MLHTDFFAIRPGTVSRDLVLKLDHGHAEAIAAETFSGIVKNGSRRLAARHRAPSRLLQGLGRALTRYPRPCARLVVHGQRGRCGGGVMLVVGWVSFWGALGRALRVGPQ